jgi:hypothetical protein
MRALGVRPCRVTHALALIHVIYGASVSAAEPAPAPATTAVQPAAPSAPPAGAPAPAAPAAAPAPAAPAPAPFNAPPESNPYPSYPAAPPGYPPGYYQPYPQVHVEPLPPGAPNTALPKAAREASRGFQMALRTGISIPVGDASGATNDSLSRRYSWQLPLVADIGAKVTDALFIGGYVGVAFGGLGSDALTSQHCEDEAETDVDCSSFGFQLGAQAIYSLDPAAHWNPWVGYGIGYESTRQSISYEWRNYAEANTSSGITAAKLMLGADYRGAVGFGPYIEAAIGRFLRTSTELNDDTVHSGPLSNQAFHAWLTLGMRLVVMP